MQTGSETRSPQQPEQQEETSKIGLPEAQEQPDGLHDSQLKTTDDQEQAAEQHPLGVLPEDKLAYIFDFLDLHTHASLLQVSKPIRRIIFNHTLRVDFWETQLLKDFSIPREISNTFVLPHLVHERLSKLKNHPMDDRLHLFRKIRYAFCAPGYDPFSMPWLFYPFTSDAYDQFIKQLNEDGAIFQNYYLDMGCRVGNLAFVQFMLKKYNLELNSERLNYACDSGNLELVQYCVEKHKVKPSQQTLTAAAISGNKSLVLYVLENSKAQPDGHTLDCSLLSGDVETVDYLQYDIQLEPSVNAANYSIESGNKELVQRFAAVLPRNVIAGERNHNDYIDRVLNPKTVSIDLIQFMINTHNFVPTQTTLAIALEGGHWELKEFLIQRLREAQPELEIDFSRCGITGDIDFVKKIIETHHQTPDLNWVLFAIFSGNVLLVKYLIDTYSLDPKNIIPQRLRDRDLDNYPLVFCHVPMAKFLIEEHGCRPNNRDFENYIRGKNLPVAHYIITECRLKLPPAIFSELNPDAPFAHFFLDGGAFEDLMDWGRQARIRELRYTVLTQINFYRQLSENPLCSALRMKESYRFEQLHPDCDLSIQGETFISAMSLFIRERMQNHAYLEITPPCSRKKQNTLEVLSNVALSIQKKLKDTGKRTKTILIPFSLDAEDREWHLLELTLGQSLPQEPTETRSLDPLSEQATSIYKQTIEAKIYSTRDYLVCKKDDPNRDNDHDWNYEHFYDYIKTSEAEDYEAVSEAVLNQFFTEILYGAQKIFGRIDTISYTQPIISKSRRSSAFSTLLTLLDKCNLFTPYKIYKKELQSYHLHPPGRGVLYYPNGGRFLSTLGSTHWRTEVLGFLFVNLERIPTLIQQGFAKTDNVKNLESTLKNLLLENDKRTPKLVTYDQREGANQFNKDNFNYDLFKEAFLESYEFDGYDSISQKFKPAFPENKNRQYFFDAKTLTFWTALAIFFGIPSRPEKVHLDEGAAWTWRQTVRNFFGGWNPIHYDDEKDKDNIEGKVLLNLFLIILPVKIGIALFKLATIPFKTALNIIKLFTEFLPAVASKKTKEWSDDLYKLRLKKIRHAHGFFPTAFAYLIYGGLSFIGTTALAVSILLRIVLRTITSPEKSARFAWAEGINSDIESTLGQAFFGTVAILYSLLSTIIFWTAITAAIWYLALPFIATQFPTLVSLFITVTHTSLIAPAVAFIKGGFLSLWAMVAEASIPLVNFGLIAASACLLIIASRLSDEFSNLWASWIPQKWNSDFKIPTIDSDAELSATEKKDKDIDLDPENAKGSPLQPTIETVADLQQADNDAASSADHADTIATRVDESPPEPQPLLPPSSAPQPDPEVATPHNQVEAPNL